MNHVLIRDESTSSDLEMISLLSSPTPSHDPSYSRRSSPSTSNYLPPPPHNPSPIYSHRSKKPQNPPSLSRELSESQIEEWEKVFDTFDTDNSGTLDADEVEFALKELGFEFSQKEFFSLFYDMDADSDGHVTFDEFLNSMNFMDQEKLEAKEQKTSGRQQILSLYYRFVDSRTGTISMETLKKGAKELNVDLDAEELFDMFDAADQGDDGEIDEEEFVTVAMKTGLFK